MSERDRLAFRIEFEADEEGLQQQVEEAVRNAKPRIEGILQEILEDMGMPEVQSARPAEAIIPKDVRDEISALGQQIQDAMKAWDMTTFQAVSTQRTKSKTVDDLVHQMATSVDRTREAGGEIGPMVSAVITNALGGIVAALEKNPEEAQRLLGSELGSITKRESIYGELAAALRAASEVMKLAEGFERGLADVEDKAAVRDWLASSISHEKLKQLGIAMFKAENPDAWLREEYTMKNIFGLMGVSDEEAMAAYKDVMVKKGTKEEDIESGFESFMRRRIDYFAVGEEGITMGETKPIADASVEREVKAKSFENEIVRRLLTTHVAQTLANLALMSEKTKEEVPSSIEPKVRGELTAFGAKRGSAEAINMTEGWKYKEIGPEATQVAGFNWTLMKPIWTKLIESMIDQDILPERAGEHLLSASTIDEIMKKLEIATSGKRDPRSTSMTDETLRVREPSSRTDTSIPAPVETLLRETKGLAAALLQVAEKIADKFPEEASELRGIIGAGRTMDYSEGL